MPSGSLDFEIEGILFHNRSLGLDRAFDVLGHQCSSGQMQPQPPADRMTYTPNRHWPANAKAARTALVVAIGGPPQRFQQHMQVRASCAAFLTTLHVSHMGCVGVLCRQAACGRGRGSNLTRRV